LDRCLGACVHEISVTNYKEVVKQVRLFLEGRNQELLKQLQRDMTAASESLNFESAARIRDQINAVERVLERQDVVSTKLEDRDVIGLAVKDGAILLVVLFIRKGYLTGSRDYRIKHKAESQSEVIDSHCKAHRRPSIHHRLDFGPGRQADQYPSSPAG
jgi:excinuclease ABC subunit C